MKIAKDRFEIDLNPCILWQYNDAHNLHRLLQGEYDFFDFCTNQFWKNYIEFIFNVASASRTGLERWARLVGVQTHYATKVNAEPEKTKSGTVYIEKHEKGTEFRSMTDDFLRRAIIARFFLLDSNGSCDAINRYLKLLYGTVAIPSDTSTISVYDGSKWYTVNKSRLNYIGQSASDSPEEGDWYSNGKYCFVRVSSKWVAVNNPILVNKGNEEPYDPKAGWYYVKGATLDAKVYSSDVATPHSYTWELNKSTMTGTYTGVFGGSKFIVRPMEIYYWMRNNTAAPTAGDYFMTGNVATITVANGGTVNITGTPRPAVAGLMRVVSGKVQIFDGSKWVNTNAASLTEVENGWYYKKSASVTSVFFGGEWHDLATASLSQVAAGWWYSVPDTMLKMLFDGSSWHTISALGLDTLYSGNYYVRNGVTYVWDSSLSAFREFDGLLSAVAKGAYYYDPSTGFTRVYGGSSWLSVHGSLKPAAIGEYYATSSSGTPSVHVFNGAGFTDISGASKLTFKGTSAATADVSAGDWYTQSGDTFIYNGEEWIELDGVATLAQIAKPGSAVKGTYYTQDGYTHVFTGQYWVDFYGVLRIPMAGDFRSASSVGGTKTALFDGTKWLSIEAPAPVPFPVGANYKTTDEEGVSTISVFTGSRWADFAADALNEVEKPVEGGEPQTYGVGDYYADGGKTFIFDGTDWIAFDTETLSEVAAGGYWTRSTADGVRTSVFDGEAFVDFDSALNDRSAEESTGENYSVGGDFFFKAEDAWEKVAGLSSLTPIDAPAEPVAGQYYKDTSGDTNFVMLYDGLTWLEIDAADMNYRGEGEPTAEKNAGDYYVQGATVNVYDGRIWVGVNALTLKQWSERPSSPTAGDWYSDASNTYLWLGDSWLTLPVSTLNYKGNARPSGVYAVGDWYVTGQTFIWDAANNRYVGIAAPIDEQNSVFANGDYYIQGGNTYIYDSEQSSASPWLVFADGLTEAAVGEWWTEGGKTYVYDGTRGIEFANALSVVQAGDYGRVGSSILVCKSSAGTAVEWVEVAASSLVEKSAPSAGWWYSFSDGTARLYDGSSWNMVGSPLVSKSAPSAGWWYDEGDSLMMVYISASAGWKEFPSGIGYAEGGAWFVSGSNVSILDGSTSTWTTLTGVSLLKSISADSAYESVANDKYYEDLSDEASVERARDSLRNAGFSDEEIYTLTLLANQRVFLPAPAGVRINGLDDDIPLRRRASVYFSFELEALEPSNINTQFSDDISIGSLDHTKIAEAT